MSPSPSCPNRGAHKGIQERRKNNDVAVLAGSGDETTKSEPCQWPRTARTSRTDRAVTVEFKIMSGVTLEERDLTKALDELLKPTDPPEGAAVKNTTETLSRRRARLMINYHEFIRKVRAAVVSSAL